MIAACQVVGRGSIPRGRTILLFDFIKKYSILKFNRIKEVSVYFPAISQFHFGI